jgi:4-amino-4-deoxy-L-arabinose transferase-like glycosyltransferase
VSRRTLYGALGLGLAIRIPLLVHAERTGVPGDQIQYSAQALANAKGNWFQQPFDLGAPAAEHPPLTSTLLTPVSWLFEDHGLSLAQRLVVLAVGMLNIVLLWHLGRRWSGRVANLAALLAAVDVHLFLSDVLILSETFGVTLVTLLLLVLTTSDEARRVGRDAVVVGVLLGLLLLTRPELTLLVPLVCIERWTAGSPPRLRVGVVARALVPGLVALVVVAPWVAWNMARFDEPTTLSTNDGFTLLGANCPDTYYGDNIGGYSINCALSVTGAPDDDASVVSALRREVAVEYARDNAERLALVASMRFVRQWEIGFIGRTAGDSVAEGRPPWLVLVGSVQWWIYGALAVVGLSRMGRRRRWQLLMTPFVVTVAAVTVNAQWRVRSSAEPAIVVAAAVGLAVLLDVRRRRTTSTDG